MNAEATAVDPMDLVPMTLDEAQKELAKVAMAMQMRPEGAAMSAYINGLLQSARISALCKFIIGGDVGIDAELTRLTILAIMEDIVPKLDAQKAPKIIRAN